MRVFSRRVSLLVLALTLPVSWLANGDESHGAVFAMPQSSAYAEECGSCHTAYAPGFLPARSWQTLMGELSNHFGEDASLDADVRKALTNELVRYASDSPRPSMLMQRINGSIPPQEAPQRISRTGFFHYMHDEVPAHIWKRKKIGSPANCGACHSKANSGRYLEGEVSIPK